MPFVLDAVEELRSTDIKIGSTTGYNDKMMGIVALAARGQGCEPDFMITPDSTNGKGRPYSYMMFRNMEAHGVQNVVEVAKVSDTISDIKEGKNAGVFTIGVIEGSSELVMTQEEFEALDGVAREAACAKVAETFRAAGADAIIRNFSELPALIRQIA